MTDLINLYRQAEDYFFRGISSKSMDLGDGAHAYMTGGAALNFIYITKNTNALDKVLIQGKEFFDQHNLAFEVIIPQEFPLYYLVTLKPLLAAVYPRHPCLDPANKSRDVRHR